MTNINLNFAEVEARITQKRDRLVKLLNDPELAPYVAALRNGHQSKPSTERKPFTAPIGFKNGHGIRDSIRKLLKDDSSALAAVKQFDRNEVKAHLDEIHGKDSYSLKAIGDALHHLGTSKNRAVKKVSGGEGGRPNMYERV